MFKPLNDRILVRKIESPERTESGLYIPKTVEDSNPCFQAEVLAVGSGKTLKDGSSIPVGVNVGDIVVIGKYLGQTLKWDGADCLVVRFDDILGVIEG